MAHAHRRSTVDDCARATPRTTTGSVPVIQWAAERAIGTNVTTTAHAPTQKVVALRAILALSCALALVCAVVARVARAALTQTRFPVTCAVSSTLHEKCLGANLA